MEMTLSSYLIDRGLAVNCDRYVDFIDTADERFGFERKIATILLDIYPDATVLLRWDGEQLSSAYTRRDAEKVVVQHYLCGVPKNSEVITIPAFKSGRC